MSRKTCIAGTLAGVMPLLAASEGVAASLRAAHAAPDLLGTAALGGMVVAGAGATAVAAMPAVRRVVMPPPAETHLSDLLQFDRCDDGVTIRTKDGALVQTLLLRGIDTGGMTGDELDAYVVRRKAWFEKISSSKLTIEVLTKRDLASYELAARYEQPILQAIQDSWNLDFERVYVNRNVLVITVPKDGRAERQALRDSVRDATDQLAAYGPELLTNGAGAYSPLLSFWAALVNGFPTRIGSFTDRLSERLVANTVQFGPEEGLIRHINGTSTVYSAVLSLSEWGEESAGRIIRDLLRLEGRLTILQVIQGLDKAQAVFDLAKNARQALLGFKNPFASGDFEEAEANIQGDRGSYL